MWGLPANQSLFLFWGKTIYFVRDVDEDDDLEQPVVIRQSQFGVWFTLDEVEEVSKYNPKQWNNYPDVTPPENVPMRVEVRSSWCGYKAQMVDGQWRDMRGDAIFDGPEGAGIEGPVVRFRPWEDEA